MDPHEIVGSVMFSDNDATSETVELDIITDKLPDDPRLYISTHVDGKYTIISFPLKEVFRAIEKEILS